MAESYKALRKRIEQVRGGGRPSPRPTPPIPTATPQRPAPRGDRYTGPQGAKTSFSRGGRQPVFRRPHVTPKTDPGFSAFVLDVMQKDKREHIYKGRELDNLRKFYRATKVMDESGRRIIKPPYRGPESFPGQARRRKGPSGTL